MTTMVDEFVPTSDVMVAGVEDCADHRSCTVAGAVRGARAGSTIERVPMLLTEVAPLRTIER